MKSEFLSPEYFSKGNNGYNLLPFRFQQITQTKEIIVNDVGDFIICPVGTANRITERKISSQDEIYPDLISKYFISESDKFELIDILQITQLKER